MSKKVINIKEQTYTLRYDEFDEDINIDDLLKIDYSNLIGEMVTFPVVVNRFGNLLAEAESQLAERKLNMEVQEAKIKERVRQAAIEKGEKAPTVETLNNAVITDKVYQTVRKSFIEAQKTRDYISSVFWSAKDKSEKLNKLSLSIQPGELSEQLIEGIVNNVTIKRTKKLID